MTEPVERTWVALTADERRVLGVLVEKAKTTPDVYPLSLAAIVTGCNQKSNRDPLVSYDADDVEEICNRLRKKGVVIMVESGGRVVRYKHLLYEWLRVNKVELAVMAELLLRGSQTEGDLRARASRMEPLSDLAALQEILDSLHTKELIVYLSPPGVRRGVVVTHNLYPPKELEREQTRYSQGGFEATAGESAASPRPAANPTASPRSAGPTLDPAEVVALRVEVDTLRDQLEGLQRMVENLTTEVHDLKSALGA